MNTEKIGIWLFLIGLVISVAAGIYYATYATQPEIIVVAGLFLLGIIVGAINVTGQEVQTFLLGTVALMLVGNSLSLLSSLGTAGAWVAGIITHFTIFVAGGALLVALKAVYAVTSSK